MCDKQYTAKDFKSDQYVRWCPGCGDHAIVNTLQKAMAELGVAPEDTVVISGIGCSSRLPYYMGTYGFHTIHGRGAAIATGVKVANPKLSVWQVTGDGDCMAIGGNHFIHSVRRNVDLNIVLMNNKIYGLTKGQYSPTSPRGFVSKSSPYGTVEEPFIPAELALGARGNFFARSLDVDMNTSKDVLVAAARHHGASVVEILQNCVIFNDGIHNYISDKTTRAERTIILRHGEKMVFGANNDKGIVLDGFKLKAVTIGQDGYTMDDVLVHDATEPDNALHFKLAMMGCMGDTDMPVAMGVIRNVDAPTYDACVEQQVEEVKNKKKDHNLMELLMQGETWEVK
ncbi:MAG: 2-oxoacid:ferredoxin oxidoreductase subunit beta [Flavobacteriales bacterium]|nr:2-oxoacid:ferredoxin oxidoreductase subunit beta [Flavobacteriales bacterium]PWM12518.1 MAG: 2-oxoacid:ferredoxin oxidoreductase subunit beta [Flavobacteriales bacterium]